MTREDFAAQCERGALQTSALPVTSAILRWTSEQLKKGEPPWWRGIAKAWEKRRFVAWAEAWSLYLACLHFEALNDADCRLVPYFPSCGGTAEADPTPGLARFLAAPPASFYSNLRERHRRAYAASRAALWMGPALSFFQRRELPYYLVEADAGAGLDLAADLTSPVKGFDSELIAARVGLDPAPLDLSDLEHRRWITASIWPDHAAMIAQLDASMELVQKRCGAEPSFLQLAPCAAEKAPAFLAKNVPAGDPDVGLLIFNMGATSRMDDGAYGQYASAMAAALKPWGERALWLEVESVRGETYSSTLQLRLHRLGAAPKSLVAATFDLAARRQSIHPGIDEFLAAE